MRRILTGVDDHGRSYVVDDRQVASQSIPGMSIRSGPLFATESSPPRSPAYRTGVAYDTGIAPGLVHWMFVEHPATRAHEPPDISATMHQLDAIELVYVVSGTTRLMLDTGSCDLEAGDCAVLPGVNHCWVDGDEGCRLLVLTMGTQPPS